MKPYRFGVATKLGVTFCVVYAVSLAFLLTSVMEDQEALLAERSRAQHQVMAELLKALMVRQASIEDSRVIGRMVMESSREWDEATLEMRWSLTEVGLFAALLGTLVTMALARVVTLPVVRLREELVTLARGERLPRLPFARGGNPAGKTAGDPKGRGAGSFLNDVLQKRGDELDQLREGFHLLVHELERRMIELERTTQEREFAKRLAEIGAMAAMVAHEVRNPLNTIQGAVYYLKSAYGEDTEVREFVELIAEQVARLASVTSHLLDASRPLEPAKVPLQMNDVVRETSEAIIAEQEREDIKLELRLDEALPSVPVERFHLHQVIENLIENSLQAMPGGGTISVETARDGENAVVLRIADDGIGVPPSERDRIFEPFYTTRTNGTGLGLYIVNRIVKAHGGAILVDAPAAGGTCFEIQLPLNRPQASLTRDAREAPTAALEEARALS